MRPTLDQIKNMPDFSIRARPKLYVIDNLVTMKEILSWTDMEMIPPKYKDLYRAALPWTPPPAGLMKRSDAVGLDELKIVMVNPTNEELQALADAQFIMVDPTGDVVFSVHSITSNTSYNFNNYEVTFNFLINRRIEL